MRFAPFILAAALCAAGASGAARAADSSATVDAVAEARGFFEARHYREAVSVLNTYLAKNPRDAVALVLRGDAKASLDDNTGALIDYNAAIVIAPQYQYAYETRCETRLQLDDSSGALDDCNEAVRLDPKDGKAFEDRADVYFDRSAYSQALDDYDKAVALGRSTAYVFAARCDANRLVGNMTRAADDCAKTLVLDPKSRRGLWANARLAMVNGKFSDAVPIWNAYIAKDAEHSNTAYYYRAAAYTRAGNAKAALPDLDVYMGRVQKDPDAYRERGFARAATGDAAGALADLKEAARLYGTKGNTAAADKLRAAIGALQAGQPLPALPAP